MRLKLFRLPLIFVIFHLLVPSAKSDIITDGLTPETAAYSARQILDINPFAPDGIYWFDELMGVGVPFQAFADMTTNGGGWTLGIVSLDSAPVSGFAITTNSGIVSSPFTNSHTRDIDYLGVSQDATFHYLVRQGGSTIFDGTYFGRFDDVTPTFSTTTDTFGLNGQLDRSFDFHRPGRDYDVSVLVRESTTPPPRSSAVPEPSTLLHCILGVLAYSLRRRRRGPTIE